jgi:hypothetical protein
MDDVRMRMLRNAAWLLEAIGLGKALAYWLARAVFKFEMWSVSGVVPDEVMVCN